MATGLEPTYPPYPAQYPGCFYWTDPSDSTGHRWPKHRSVEYHTYSSNNYMLSNGPTRDHYRDNNGHNQMGSSQYSPYQSNEGPEHIECNSNFDFVIPALNIHEQDKIINKELTARNRCARCFKHNTLNFRKNHNCYWQDCRCSECTKLVEKQINRKLLKSKIKDIKVVNNRRHSRLTKSLWSSLRDDSLNGNSETRGCQCLQFPCIEVLENSANELGLKAFKPNDKVALVNQQDNQSEFSLKEKIEDEGVLDFILDYCPG